MNKVEIRSGTSIVVQVMNYLAHINKKIKRAKRPLEAKFLVIKNREFISYKSLGFEKRLKESQKGLENQYV